MVCGDERELDERVMRHRARSIFSSALLIGATILASAISIGLVGHGVLVAMAISVALSASIVVSAGWIERTLGGGARLGGVILATAVLMAGSFLAGTKNLGMLPLLSSSSLFVLLTVPHRDDAEATTSGATIVAASIIAAAMMLRFG